MTTDAYVLSGFVRKRASVTLPELREVVLRSGHFGRPGLHFELRFALAAAELAFAGRLHAVEPGRVTLNNDNDWSDYRCQTTSQ